MSSTSPTNLASVLLKRFECLHVLIDQPQAKPELVELLDIPRSTLDDIVRELEQAQCVEYEDGQWHPTHAGQLAYRAHRDYLDRLDSLGNVSSVLEEIDATDDIGWEFIDSATIHETHPNIQDAVMTTLLDYVEAGTDVRIVTPNIVAGYLTQFYESGVSGKNATLEMIIPPEIHRWFHSTYPSVSADALNNPNVTVLGDSIPFSFGLSIFDDDRVVVIAFTEQGIAGLLVNDTDDALNWAEEQYERVKQKADPIPLHGGIQEPTQQ